MHKRKRVVIPVSNCRMFAELTPFDLRVGCDHAGDAAGEAAQFHGLGRAENRKRRLEAALIVAINQTSRLEQTKLTTQRRPPDPSQLGEAPGFATGEDQIDIVVRADYRQRCEAARRRIRMNEAGDWLVPKTLRNVLEDRPPETYGRQHDAQD